MRKRKKFSIVRKVLADDSVMFYYYTAKGEGSSFYQSSQRFNSLDEAPQDFLDAYSAQRVGIDADSTFGKLALDYRRSPKYQRYADATKRDIERYISLALEMSLKGGKVARNAPLKAFDRVEIIPYLNRWRDSMARTPRQADMAIGVVRRILAFGCSEGRLCTNRAVHIESLYEAPIDEGEGWQDNDFRRFIGPGCASELALAARFIRCFGMRRKDAVEIQISAIQGDTLVWKTSKGRKKKRTAIAPILLEGRQLVNELLEDRENNDVVATTLLVNSHGRPWTPDGLSSSFDKRRRKLGIEPTMHALRSNYSTDLVVAHTKRPDVITRAVVCRALGWGEEQLDQMIRVYVDDTKVIDALTNKASPQNGNQVETETTNQKESGA